MVMDHCFNLWEQGEYGLPDDESYTFGLEFTS